MSPLPRNQQLIFLLLMFFALMNALLKENQIFAVKNSLAGGLSYGSMNYEPFDSVNTINQCSSAVCGFFKYKSIDGDCAEVMKA